jgi:sporulation protein YlmC with PRC-barrel domain
MGKILVFSSLLVFATGAFAQGQTAQQQSGEQQSAAAQTTTGQTGSQDRSMQGQSGQDQAAGGQQQQEQKQTLEYDFAASKLMGKKVTNGQGEEIGSISDVIVRQNDKVSHAVIGVGGFLGIGERKVAVPFDQLQVQNEQVVYQQGDRQQLTQMPEFQYKEEAQKQQQAQQQQQQQDQQRAQQQSASREAPPLPGQRQ